MKGTGISEQLEKGGITFADRREEIDGFPWNAHPSFKGVSLKHLVKGADTEGRLSCHIVRIDPGCVLEEHIHDGQWELHEVIQGAGIFLVNGRETAYHPGQMAIIPKGTGHKVVAGSGGLVLLAKFFPALI